MPEKRKKFSVNSLIIREASFGIWQAWWLSTVWLAAGLFVASGGTGDRARHERYDRM
jgi:hypothetical protein